MTESEFKAWFEGFCEGIEGNTPTAKQWKRIKARVKDISGVPVSPIVIEKWRDRYVPYWEHRPYTVALSTGKAVSVSASGDLVPLSEVTGELLDNWNAEAVLAIMGQAEAQDLAGKPGTTFKPTCASDRKPTL